MPHTPETPHTAHMVRALELAATVRGTTAPNPWVGAVVVSAAGEVIGEGATAPPGGPHAERTAIAQAAERHPDALEGATLYVTLEPCAHTGRTPPCVDAILDTGIARVVVGVRDPDERVSGKGKEALEEHGVEVATGVLEDEITDQLAPYLKHRRTGEPWVVLKLAATVDGRTAAPDGTSKYLTGEAARRDVHRLRADSDAVLVGAGTVRTDDPELTVRTDPPPERQPLRVVLGEAPEGARIRPALELRGDLRDVLKELGRRGVLQVLVEGGPTVAHQFHHAGLVDRYVFYLAPALFGGDDAKPMFTGAGAVSLDRLWRGKLLSVERLGDDVRLELAAA
jgi:diaminohydroxyphosphoribosylaminopyrimidine deaminase/5-amino-6-(5-phosphoribosylamino)uracil reductase